LKKINHRGHREHRGINFLNNLTTEDTEDTERKNLLKNINHRETQRENIGIYKEKKLTAEKTEFKRQNFKTD